jgi:adenylosuccinate synthase
MVRPSGIKYAIQVNGVTQLMMIGDVLSGFETLKVCTDYTKEKNSSFPYNIEPENVTQFTKNSKVGKLI